MDAELVKVLSEVGFTDKEAQVYLALLTLNSGTVQQIAKASALKRPIIYVVLEGLIKRGYASELPDKKTQTFQVVPASVVLKRLQSNVANFTQYIPIFRTLGNRGGLKPKITYIDTKDGIQNIFEEINHDPVPLLITSYARIDKHFPGLVNRWINNCRKGLYKKLRGMHIIPDSEKDFPYVGEFLKVNQKVRASSALENTKMDISIYGNKVSISSLGERLFAVVIESQDIVDSLRPVFSVMWNESKEIS